MSGYFTRLVQRASGAEQRNHATPAVHGAQVSSDTHDPFEANAPVGPPPVSSVHVGSREAPQEIPARAALQARPSIEPRRESESIAPQPALAPKSVALHQDRVPQAKDLTSKEQKVSQLVERKVVEREVTRELLQRAPNAAVPEVQPISPVELSKPSLDRALPQPEKPAPAPFPPAQIPVLAASELRPPLEPLKPQKQAIPAPAVVPREEPRLVIGRMQVEVIPVAPAAPPRVSAQPRRRSAPTEGTAPSRLQFGLAQM